MNELAEQLSHSPATQENNVESLESKNIIEAFSKSQGVAEFGLDGTVLTANEKFTKSLGFSVEELRTMKLERLCDSQYASSSEFRNLWDSVMRGEMQSGEFKLIGKNNREVFLIATFHPIKNNQSKVYKVLNISTDVTPIKSELKVRTDIMNVTSIVSEADLKGDILSINDKFIEVSKYSRDELMGKPHNTTRHPDMPKEVFKEMWGTIGRGKIFRGIVKNRAKDGTPYYVDAVIAPIMGENGKPRKYLGVRYDITNTETERQNMLGIIRAIDASYAYIEFDTQGNVLKANKNFQDAMGYSTEDLKQKHHRIFCDPAYTSTAQYSDFWSDLRLGKSKSGVFKRLTHSGKDIWLQAVYSPVTDETGRVAKVIKIATDVTEQQKMVISIQETSVALSSAAAELMATATEMTGTANKTNQESQSAAVAAEEVSTGVQTVATNVEEMVASIKEIARSTNEASNMSKATLEKARESNANILRLGVSSQEIGDVIKVISSIAQQTNLLALNATIEAARAGEAGKGFAVVANEVKELAKQTAKATNDITNKIGAIQGDSKNAVDAIGGISQSIEKLNSISSVIAAAVEEQTATTNEISRVIVESKKGIESIAKTVKTVSAASQESTASSTQTLAASKELTILAEKLTALLKNRKQTA